MSELLHSPVNERHIQLGAKFSEFGGWEMPLDYSGVVSEHTAVRDRVGVFDVSHLGKILVQGTGAAAYLNTRLANDLGKIVPGKAQYTMLCNESGGVVDDLIAYLKSDDEVFLIPNAANTTTVFNLLAQSAPDQITLINQHRDFAILAVQGPQSPEVIAAMGVPTDMDYMGFAVAERNGATFTVCRTGYTGELGFELVVPNALALDTWDRIMAAGEPFGILPCGLGARDTLRTEMGYPLHGQDLSPVINPVAAGISWAIGWKKPVFDGAQALRSIRETGPDQRLRGLKAIGRGIPRPHMKVVAVSDGADLGEVTSGTFSPTLKEGIALALIDASVQLGDEVGVQVRNRTERFEVVKPPFVTPSVR
jgi:aminomethyltransferase